MNPQVPIVYSLRPETVEPCRMSGPALGPETSYMEKFVEMSGLPTLEFLSLGMG